MPTVDDPYFVASLQKLFATHGDLKTIVEYQQRLYASMKELDTNHRTIHTQVQKLTSSHNILRTDANDIIKMKSEINDRLRSISDSHAKTRQEIERVLEAIEYIKGQVSKIPDLEKRLTKLERQNQNIWHDEQSNDKKVAEQEKRLNKLERK